MSREPRSLLPWLLPRGLIPIVAPSSPVTPSSNIDEVNTSLPWKTSSLSSPDQDRHISVDGSKCKNTNFKFGMSEQKSEEKGQRNRHRKSTNNLSNIEPVAWPMPPRIPLLVGENHGKPEDESKQTTEKEEKGIISPIPITNVNLFKNDEQQQPQALRPLPSTTTDDSSYYTPPETVVEELDETKVNQIAEAVFDRISRLYPPAPRPPTFSDLRYHKLTTSKESSSSSSSDGSDSIVDVLDLFSDLPITKEESIQKGSLLKPVNEDSVRIHRTIQSRPKGKGDMSFLNVSGLRSLFSDDVPTSTEQSKPKHKRSRSEIAPNSQVMTELSSLVKSNSTYNVNNGNKPQGNKQVSRKNSSNNKRKRKGAKKKKLAKTKRETEVGQLEQNNAQYEKNYISHASESHLALKPQYPFEDDVNNNKNPVNNPTHNFSNITKQKSIPNLPSSGDESVPKFSKSLVSDNVTELSMEHQSHLEKDSIAIASSLDVAPTTSTTPKARIMKDENEKNQPFSSIARNNDNNNNYQTTMIQRPTADYNPLPPFEDDLEEQQSDDNGDDFIEIKKEKIVRHNPIPRGKTGVVVRDVPKRPPMVGIRRAETGFIMSRAELQRDGPPTLLRDNPNPKSLAYFPIYESVNSSYHTDTQQVKDEYNSSSSSSSVIERQEEQHFEPIQIQSPIESTSDVSSIFDEPISRSLVNLSLAAHVGSQSNFKTPYEHMGRSPPNLLASINKTSNNNSSLNLASKLSTGIRWAKRAVIKRPFNGNGSPASAASNATSPRNTNKNEFDNNNQLNDVSDLTLNGSLDESVIRICYVCREIIKCNKVEVKENGKKIKVEIFDQKQKILLRLSLILKSFNNNMITKIKLKQTKNEMLKSNISTMFEFYSKLEQNLKENQIKL